MYGFLVDHALHAMQGGTDLELLGGVLDICLALLRHGHMLDVTAVETLFEVLVATLDVGQIRPRSSGGEQDEQASAPVPAPEEVARPLPHLGNASLLSSHPSVSLLSAFRDGLRPLNPSPPPPPLPPPHLRRWPSS